MNDAPERPAADAARDAFLLDLARRRFSVETLETRNSDGEDFHDVAVWSIRAALEEAYEAGRHAAAVTAAR